MASVTSELLAQYAVLLNRFGASSKEAEVFLQNHQDDKEFLELAETSRWLKQALTAPDLSHCNSSSGSNQ